MAILTEYARYQKIKDAIKDIGKRPFSADEIAQKVELPIDEVEKFLKKLGGIVPANEAGGLRGVFAKKGTYIQK